MKTAKPRAETHGRKRGAHRKVRGTVAPMPPEARRSTAAALLKHAPGWAGNDLDEIIAIVATTRTKTRF
jgi:hypothetical protein